MLSLPQACVNYISCTGCNSLIGIPTHVLIILKLNRTIFTLSATFRVRESCIVWLVDSIMNAGFNQKWSCFFFLLQSNGWLKWFCSFYRVVVWLYKNNLKMYFLNVWKWSLFLNKSKTTTDTQRHIKIEKIISQNTY